MEVWQIALLASMATCIATAFCIRSIAKSIREAKIKKELDSELAGYFADASKE